ncbi:MAG: type I restriction endonuclease [Prochlorotrichaceae cyanobacterium]
MPQTLPASEVTLRSLKQSLNLQAASSVQFFPEWQIEATPCSEIEQTYLDRVQANFLDLLEEPPALENSVKMVVLAPLLDLAGLYRRPFRITTETSIEIELEDEDRCIRGRIDVLVVRDSLWLVVIESKRSDFSVSRALPQTLAYMLGNPQADRATFGLMTNGTEFMFLKTQQRETETSRLSQYATSRLFSLFNPGNELAQVLAILKHLAHQSLQQ